MNENKKASGVAILALIVAVLALIIGWIAFNRTGVDLEDIIEREVEEASQEIEREYQEAEEDFRAEVSSELDEAAADAAVDGNPNSAGE